ASEVTRLAHFTDLLATSSIRSLMFLFFFTLPAPIEPYTLSLHDALPISFEQCRHPAVVPFVDVGTAGGMHYLAWPYVEAEPFDRSEEHTSELQSLAYLVCRLLLEKKKKRQ